MTLFIENLYSDGHNTIGVDPVTLAPTVGRLSHNRTVPEHNNLKYRVYNGTADYDLGGANLISSTSYGTVDQAAVEDETSYYGPTLTAIFGQPLGALIHQG